MKEQPMQERTPSGVAVELKQLGNSLDGIARDIERGIEQGHADRFSNEEAGFVRHVTERIETVESLLQRMRNEIAATPWRN